MENIVLNNGVEIPALGFGVFQIGVVSENGKYSTLSNGA
jgi:diketogulonate reductase-like aldo/keto reductase